jgi:hypothetical protein
MDNDQNRYRELMERLNLPIGITAELLMSGTRAFCRIYFDGMRTNFCLDENGNFFYLDHGIPIRSSKNVVISVYKDFANIA